VSHVLGAAQSLSVVHLAKHAPPRHANGAQSVVSPVTARTVWSSRQLAAATQEPPAQLKPDAQSEADTHVVLHPPLELHP
jgi:hypothetical protein